MNMLSDPHPADAALRAARFASFAADARAGLVLLGGAVDVFGSGRIAGSVPFDVFLAGFDAVARDEVAASLRGERGDDFEVECRLVDTNSPVCLRGQFQCEEQRAVGVAFVPVRDRDRFEEQLQQRTDALAEADRRRDAFLDMLAHELRNPLAPVVNSLYILDRMDGDTAAVRRACAMTARQVRHLARLVDDLLEVSRLRTGRISLRPARIDLAGLVRASADDHRVNFGLANQRLEVDIPDQPVWIFADATRIAQILDNLLDNAGKFSNTGGVVRVSLTASDEAVVTVRDTGIGIDSGLLPHLFEPLTQADHGHAPRRGGLGLGLALVRGLAELHGGRAEAASDGPGQGASFSLRLPLAGVEASEDGDGSTPREGGSHRVLIVEDNRDTADSLRLVLQMAGHVVAVAYDGLAGLALAREFTPDVLLCDIGLPGLDGLGVARALREKANWAGLMIAVSGYGQEEDRRRSLGAGFDMHLVKPVDPMRLQELIADAPRVEGVMEC